MISPVVIIVKLKRYHRVRGSAVQHVVKSGSDPGAIQTC